MKASANEPTMSRHKRRKIERKERLERNKQRREKMKSLREAGIVPPARGTPSNSKRSYGSIGEERQDRTEAGTEYLKALRPRLKWLFQKLSTIHDYRDARKIKHRIAVVMMFGLLGFLFHKASRREANRELTTAAMIETLGILFPEWDCLPHHDTVNRVLSKIDINEIGSIHLDLIRQLIKKKTFDKYLVRKRYVVAIDGTQKASLSELWAEECLQKGKDENERFYCYVLEANLALTNGMSIPLTTEFCEYQLGVNDKQDCEYRALERMTARLKAAFPRLRMTISVDGLYANGPVVSLLREYGWDFMIMFQDGNLPTVWENALQIRQFLTEEGKGKTDTAQTKRGGRQQDIWWVNHINYVYGSPECGELLHIVVCDESWEELAEDSTEMITKTSRFAWISKKPLDRENVYRRCNWIGRPRWTIETSFLVEKHRSYYYEHLFSKDWNAMKGYHLLMRLAHALNELAFYTKGNAQRVKKEGQMAFIRFIERTFTGNWLCQATVREELSRPYQLRFA